MGNGGGGGGGGLPPIVVESTELYNDTMAFERGGSAYSGAAVVDFSTVVGQQYAVNWDSVPYTCTAVDIGSGFGVIGNLAILGAGEDTGEPFVGYAYEGALVLMTASTAASHDVKIDGRIQNPPDGSVLTVIDGAWGAASRFENASIIRLNTEWEVALSVSSGSTKEFVSDATFPPEYIGIENLLVLNAFCTSHPQLMYTGDGYIDTEQSKLHLTFINPTANTVTESSEPVFITVYLVSPEESFWVAAVAGE